MDVKLTLMKQGTRWLNTVRAQTSLTQADVMACLRIARSNLSAMENNRTDFSEQDLIRLRRLFILPHFPWERGRDDGYDTPPYKVRKRIAESKAEEFLVARAMLDALHRGFKNAEAAGKAHLFIFCFQDFLAQIGKLHSETAQSVTALPAVTLRAALRSEYLRHLTSEAERLRAEARVLLSRLGNDRSTGSAGSGRALTYNRRATSNKSLVTKLARAEHHEETVSSGKVSDRQLLEFLKKSRAIGLPGGSMVLWQSDTNLDDELQLREYNKTPLESYWTAIFSAITSSNPEADDLSWDDAVPDYRPCLTFELRQPNTVWFKIGRSEDSRKLLYVTDDRLPLERESFKDATKRKEGFVCVVTFKVRQAPRYLQLISIDADDVEHTSPIYLAYANGSTKELCPTTRSALPKEKTVSKTVSKSASKGKQKQARAGSKFSVDKAGRVM